MQAPGWAFRRREVAVRAAGLCVALLVMTGCQPRPVAVVNGEALSEKQFALLCETANQIRPQAGTVGFQVLIQWIRNAVLAQEAKKLGVYPSEKELDERMEAFRRQVAFTGSDFDQGLRSQGLTLEAFRRDLLTSMISDNVFYRGVEISDADVQKEFERGRNMFSIPEQVQMSQITLDSEEKLKQAQRDLAANTNFGLVAQTHSRDQFAASGGMIPEMLQREVPRGGPVAQAAVDAAFKLEEGQSSEPIKIGATWVIVKVDKKIARKDPKLEDVREIIRAGLRERKARESGKASENQRLLATTMQSAQIQINRPEYQMLQQQIAQSTGAPPGAPAATGHEGHDHSQPGGGH